MLFRYNEKCGCPQARECSGEGGAFPAASPVPYVELLELELDDELELEFEEEFEEEFDDEFELELELEFEDELLLELELEFEELFELEFDEELLLELEELLERLRHALRRSWISCTAASPDASARDRVREISSASVPWVNAVVGAAEAGTTDKPSAATDAAAANVSLFMVHLPGHSPQVLGGLDVNDRLPAIIPPRRLFLRRWRVSLMRARGLAVTVGPSATRFADKQPSGRCGAVAIVGINPFLGRLWSRAYKCRSGRLRRARR